MTKKKAERFGQAGGKAVKKTMGKGWHKILADLRWGKISKSEFRRLKAQRQKSK